MALVTHLGRSRRVLPTVCKSLRKPALIEAMTTDTPESRFECFHLAYPSGTVVDAYYGGGAALGKVKATHSLAVVKAVEASRVSAEADRT